MTNRYVPEKSECMPKKNILFARAGVRYSRGVEDVELLRRTNALFLEGLNLINPVIHYKTVLREELPVKLVPESFGETKRLTVFLSTLGFGIVERVDEYACAGRVFDAFLLDSWASESLEALNDSFDRQLRQEFGEGTRRFSPGYGKVDVRMNRYIVEEFLGLESVRALKSGALVPRKTTTCMIGWFS